MGEVRQECSLLAWGKVQLQPLVPHGLGPHEATSFPFHQDCRNKTSGKCPDVNLSGDGLMLGLPDVAENSS
ncbi:hypothetical protein TNCV_2848211 [Trichonephila clavipes]|nr:hypothetical protein TNCV_2848211 [Trichonephila clavipes]